MHSAYTCPWHLWLWMGPEESRSAPDPSLRGKGKQGTRQPVFRKKKNPYRIPRTAYIGPGPLFSNRLRLPLLAFAIHYSPTN
jgi:hypothetical protein